MKKFLYMIVATLMFASGLFVFGGCAEQTNLGVVELPYYDEEDEKTDYNNSLFYRNDLLETGADPCVIKVTEGEYKDWFFLYGTTDTASCTAYACWKSKDLSNWQAVSICFSPESASWGQASLWAPGVIYDPSDGKYYLFYSAQNSASGYYKTKYLGMAVSDSPAGPFVQYTGVNGNGDEITLGDPIFDIRKAADAPFFQTDYAKETESYKKNTSFIDACPFIDSDGSKYLYMCRSRNAHSSNIISVVKMTDWATPDYSTYTELTTLDRTTLGGSIRPERSETKINEAPFMTERNGKYYLTFSINATTDPEYAVMQAVGDSPMGPFTKVQESEGGLVIGIDYMNNEWDHVLCCGSHAFVMDGDEMWIVYHQDRNRASEGLSGVGSNNRGFACDRVNWVTNQNGLEVLKANGPTTSPQPLPSSYTGYKNLAREAKITATQTVDGTTTNIDEATCKLLNDGLVRFHEIDIIDEFYAEGVVAVTLTFDDYVTARSLVIYNSCMFDSAFYRVARIDFGFRKEIDGKMCYGTARINDMYYNLEKYSQLDTGVMRPGAPLIAEFDELQINSVTITFVCPDGQENIGVSEIMLMGK